MTAFKPAAHWANPHPQRPVACFSVTAQRDPSVLPRVLEPFAKRGLVPSRVHASEEDAPGRPILIDVQVDGMPQAAAEKVGQTLTQTVGVQSVLVSAKIAG